MEVLVGGADQGEVAFVGNGEDDAAVAVLEEIAAIVVVEAAHHHVRALDEADARPAAAGDDLGQDPLDPGAGGIDQGTGANRAATAVAVLERHRPAFGGAGRGDGAGAGLDHRAALGRVEGGQHDQTGVVDAAVGIFEAAPEQPRLQRRAGRVAGEIESAGAGQEPPPTEMVVDEEAEAQEPGRTQAGVMGQDEAQRLDQMGRGAPQHLALDQRLVDEAELVILEIAQAAVDQFGRPRGGAARQIVHLAEMDREPAPGRVAGDAASVDAAADHGEIIDRLHASLPTVPAPPVRVRCGAARTRAILRTDIFLSSREQTKTAHAGSPPRSARPARARARHPSVGARRVARPATIRSTRRSGGSATSTSSTSGSWSGGSSAAIWLSIRAGGMK